MYDLLDKHDLESWLSTPASKMVPKCSNVQPKINTSKKWTRSNPRPVTNSATSAQISSHLKRISKNSWGNDVDDLSARLGARLGSGYGME